MISKHKETVGLQPDVKGNCMKKKLFMCVIVLISVMISNACAEVQTKNGLADYVGIWGDPHHDREELVILPQSSCWKDDLMGESPREDGLMMSVRWASSTTVMWNYRMIGSLDENGSLQYSGGIAECYTYAGNGDLDVDETGILEDNGSGAFTLRPDGTMTWKDSFMDEAGEMVFGRRKTSPFTAEEAVADLLTPVLMLETGTAGSALKMAILVRDIYSFCEINLVWNMAGDAYEGALWNAMEMLNESDQKLFREKFTDVAEELDRLQNEGEMLGTAYRDADVDEQMSDLRSDPSVRLSVKVLTECMRKL